MDAAVVREGGFDRARDEVNGFANCFGTEDELTSCRSSTSCFATRVSIWDDRAGKEDRTPSKDSASAAVVTLFGFGEGFTELVAPFGPT